MVTRTIRSEFLRKAAVALLLTAQTGIVPATELVGRVVDTVGAKAFAGALVRLRDSDDPKHAAQTDEQGFFRVHGLAAGSYLLDINLPDGRIFIARLVLLPQRTTQFIELDYSRAAPPDDDEDY